MTLIILDKDELKALIADAVRAGVAAALQADHCSTVLPISSGSYLARRAVALERAEKKRNTKICKGKQSAAVTDRNS